LNDSETKAITLGHPSYSWHHGQDKRLELIRRYVELEDKDILDIGCGIGTYVAKLRLFSDRVWGVDIDPEKVAQASQKLPGIQAASAENLPFDDHSFDVVLLNEVIEHVADDRAALREACRVLRPGGKMVIFAPNRLFPFETHGFYLGKRYIFGNIPLVNWLPGRLRQRFCPHVRVYTMISLRKLFEGLDCQPRVCGYIFPGFDRIALKHKTLSQFFRKTTSIMAKTSLRVLGLSLFVVAKKV